jgi:transposase-like protein
MHGLVLDLMKFVVKVRDVAALATLFRSSPGAAMQHVAEQMRDAMTATLERVMDAEIDLFLGEAAQAGNKRNGYVSRTFGVKGIGEVRVRVPRDRRGRFASSVVPPGRRYDEAIERDLALLHLAGLSTRMLSRVSASVLGVNVSAQEVSGAIDRIVPAAKRFLERPLGDRQWRYLYIDGTNFRVRRTTVEREPTLVVVGVDQDGRKSVLAMVQGAKDDRTAWAAVFVQLQERGLQSVGVELGIMDGLPGLSNAFREAFPRAHVARCWIHKARNVLPLVPKRYQKAFKVSWDAVAYANSETDAREAFGQLKAQWNGKCDDAIERLDRDLEPLLAHYRFPREHWAALRTTNPIERVNKEFKRRARAMETVSADGLKALLAFTAVRLEYGWMGSSIRAEHSGLGGYQKQREVNEIEAVSAKLFH